MTDLGALIKLREKTLSQYGAQVYRVYANGVEFLNDGRSPTVFNTGSEDVLKIPGWEQGQRSWRVSIAATSTNTENILLSADWQLINIANGNAIECRAVSIERSNTGVTYEVILVDNRVV